MKPRVYIDTSVIGGCLDEEFAVWSLKLFDEFHKRCYMKEKFDAVQFQRKARALLSKQYLEDPETFVRELEDKYGKLRKSKDRRRPRMTITPT